MELEEQSGIDTWRGAAEGGTFLLWRSSMPAAGGGAVFGCRVVVLFKGAFSESERRFFERASIAV